MKPNQRFPWGMSTLLSYLLYSVQKLINQPSHLPQDGCPSHRVRMLRSPTVDVAIQATTYLDYEGVCLLSSFYDFADATVDLRTLFPPSLDQLHCTHQTNSLLPGMSRPIDVD